MLFSVPFRVIHKVNNEMQKIAAIVTKIIYVYKINK